MNTYPTLARLTLLRGALLAVLTAGASANAIARLTGQPLRELPFKLA